MPNLTTLADVKTRFGYGSGDDALINLLLPEVDANVLSYLDRPLYAEAARAEFPRVEDHGSFLHLDLYPITSITTVHVSVGLPRVYNATTLLVADQDYLYDPESGLLYRTGGSCFPSRCRYGPATVKVVYAGGYSTIPADIKAAAEEILAVKFEKSKHKQYHVTGVVLEGDQLQGVKWEDIPPTAKDVLDSYRRRG